MMNHLYKVAGTHGQEPWGLSSEQLAGCHIRNRYLRENVIECTLRVPETQLYWECTRAIHGACMSGFVLDRNDLGASEQQG